MRFCTVWHIFWILLDTVQGPAVCDLPTFTSEIRYQCENNLTWFWPYRTHQLPQFLQAIQMHQNNDGNHVSTIYSKSLHSSPGWPLQNILPHSSNCAKTNTPKDELNWTLPWGAPGPSIFALGSSKSGKIGLLKGGEIFLTKNLKSWDNSGHFEWSQSSVALLVQKLHWVRLLILDHISQTSTTRTAIGAAKCCWTRFGLGLFTWV